MSFFNLTRVRYAAIAAGLSAMSLSAAAQSPRAFTEAELRQAAYLAANCANCHGTAGRSPGSMPSLAGVPRSYLVQQMKDFRDGKRPATIMHQLAKGYTDDQYELLGEYFARVAKP